MIRLCLVLAAACVALVASHATPTRTTPGAPSTSPTAYAGWLDREAVATVATLDQHARWESFEGWKNWSFGPEPVWLRVQVPAAAPDAPPFILVARPPFLDQLDFYDPALGIHRRTGDFFTADDEALGHVYFTFEVPAQATPREIFLRIRSTSARVVYLSLLPLPEAKDYTRNAEWVTGIVWVLSLAFLLWSLVQWWLTRDRLMGIFAVKQFFITAWGFTVLGFARISIGHWFAEGMLSMISSTVIVGLVLSVLWFYLALLSHYNARTWMLKVLHASALVVAAAGVLILMGMIQQAMQIINLLVPVSLFWLVMTLLLARPEGEQPPISKWVLLGYLGIYCFHNALPSLTLLGVVKESVILSAGNMGLLVIDGLVMLWILNLRQVRLTAQHQIVTTQLMLQREQARLDQQYMEDQRKLMAMLAHEMKTPLANLRIWMEVGPEGRPVMERAIEDMSKVIERCVHSGQLLDQSLQPRYECMDAVALTRSVLEASRLPDRVALHLPDSDCELQADVQMMSIVLGNVLENAYKYSPPGTTIGLRLQSQAGPQGEPGWLWRVDNTVGPAGQPDARRVFDKYYRGPHALRQSGSGLGLYLVKALLELMHGQVSCIGLAGQVRFEVWMPRRSPGLAAGVETSCDRMESL